MTKPHSKDDQDHAQLCLSCMIGEALGKYAAEVGRAGYVDANTVVGSLAYHVGVAFGMAVRAGARKSDLVKLWSLHDRAMKEGGLMRGRSGFYAGFATTGTPHKVSTVAALVARGLMTRPDSLSPRRVLTPAGRDLLLMGDAPATPASVARPRAYVD